MRMYPIVGLARSFGRSKNAQNNIVLTNYDHIHIHGVNRIVGILCLYFSWLSM